MIERLFSTTFIVESITSGLTTMSTPLQTNSVSLTLSEEANIGVKVYGFTTGSGSVTLQGSTSESLTFPSNGELVSLNTYSTISTVILNNLTDESTVGTVDLFMSTPTGAPITYRTVVGSNYKGRISNRKRSFDELRSGIEINTAPILFTGFDVPIKIKDYVRAVGRTFEVITINSPSDIMGNINHIEAELLEIPNA